MSTQDSQSPFVKCTDCSFITTTQGHLGIHRSKMHHAVVPDHIKSVNIVRLFPEGKSYYCCLCDSIIGSFPNFKRHSNKHKGISLNISAKCTLCNRTFTDNRGAGVHLQRGHHIGKNVDLETTTNSTTITPSRRSRRSRASLLREASLSMSCNISSPVQSSNSSQLPNGDDQVFSVNDIPSTQPPSTLFQTVNPSTPRVNPLSSCSSTPNRSSNVPTPALIDLDPVEDDVPPSPPRPNGYLTSIPSHLPTLEAVVVLSDCTAVNSNATSSVSPHSPNSSPSPNPPSSVKSLVPPAP